VSYELPTPPAELPSDIVDTLNGCTPDQLQHVAPYAEAVAEHQEGEARLDEELDENEIQEGPEHLPDDVPAKATITIKKISNNRYYYWQWREGDTVISKHKWPVNPDK
jgi:hypothetical protein